jgi:TolB-like protein
MTPDFEDNLRLEIGHVLFIDIVGYSKLLITGQSEQLEKLRKIVRGTEQFRTAEAQGKLLRLPTGDGGALVFRTSPEAPALCAMEIAQALKTHPELHVRMGIHSGPVNEVTDLNEQANIAGAGINVAQRVMDCGDAGHILLSKHIADDLEQHPRWRSCLYDLGDCEVKHGVRLSLTNLYTDEVGNRQLPSKLARGRTRRQRKMAAVGGALLAIAGCLAFLIFNRISTNGGRTLSPIPDKSVAVLPLENLTEEKENAFFADGIQDELLSNLAKIKDLKVISRTSVMQYKVGITRNLKEIAQQLGVSNVVEGSVRRSGNHVRVSVQLIDALNDRHIWQQNYDRTLADSLALQGELATQIAAGVGATLSPQEKTRVEAKPTNNAAAYDAYLRGRALFLAGFRGDFSNFERAPRSFEQAVTLDPSFALAWAYLSCADSTAYWNGVDPTPARLAAAKNAADHAVALDPNLAETHLALGYYRYYGARDFSGALAEFQLAEKSLPNNVDVILAIALIQRRLGHWDEVIAVLRRAVELDPRNVEVAFSLANAYTFTRRFSDALAMSDHMLAIEPSNSQAIGLKVFCYWGMGNLEAADEVLANPAASLHLRGHQAFNKHHDAEALELFTKARQTATGDEKRDILLDLGRTQKRLGNLAASKAAYQQAIQEFTAALKTAAGNPSAAAGWHSLLGMAYAGLGDATRAVSEGQKGMALQSTSEDPFEGPQREETMAAIYALLGDADNAIPILKRWIHVPSATGITPGALRIDPDWDPIRHDPRFQQLIAGKEQIGPNK